MSKKYLVTGGAGFIGCNLVRRLVEEGHDVRVLDNFSTGSRENLHGLDIELIEGDLTSYHMVQRAVAGVDYVLHQGALPSVPRSVSDPIASVNVNTLGTLNVLTAAWEAGADRVVYASSSSVYGDAPEFPKREDMLPSPKSPYAASKLAGEHLCRAFYETYGLETVILRYFNIFGPFQSPESEYAAVVPRFIAAGLLGRPAIVFGDGHQSRDFTFVDNVVEANLAAMAAPTEAVGRAFNIACGQSYSLLDLLDTVERILGKRIERDPRDPRPGDVRDSLADVGAARDGLGYRPAVGFQQGLERTVAWLQESLPLGDQAG
jgi:nucleoside-diphosphate-sugar epimerase